MYSVASIGVPSLATLKGGHPAALVFQKRKSSCIQAHYLCTGCTKAEEVQRLNDSLLSVVHKFYCSPLFNVVLSKS